MKTTTDATIEQQFLSQDSANNFTESSFEFLNNIEFDLESMLANEFSQGLPSDLDNPGA